MKSVTALISILGWLALCQNSALLAEAAKGSLRTGGTLYGITPNVTLATVDTATGKIQEVGQRVPYEAQAQELSALDETRGIFYLVGFNLSTRVVNLVGIDVASGAIKYNLPLPFYEGPFVGVGQQLAVEPDSGKVIVGGRMTKTGPHTIGFMDATTGKFDQVASINSTDLPVLDGVSAYDPSSKKFVTFFGVRNLGIDIFAVDMTSGEVTKIREDPEDGRELSTLDYDAKSQSLVGLGIQPGPNGGIIRTLVSLSVDKQSWTTIGKLDGYLMEDGAISALDESSRSLYWIGQKTGEAQNGSFYLIDVNLDNASVRKAVSLGPMAGCPWSLEYQG